MISYLQTRGGAGTNREQGGACHALLMPREPQGPRSYANSRQGPIGASHVVAWRERRYLADADSYLLGPERWPTKAC